TVIPSVNPAMNGQAVTFTATVTPTLALSNTLTGSVVFKDQNTVLATVALNSSNQARFATSALTQGVHTISAMYVGDTNFPTSTSSALMQTVGTPSSTTTVTSGVNPSAFGQNVTFTATVSAAGSGSGTPTGSVTFMDGTTTLGTGTLSGGSTTFSTSA